MRLIKRKMPNYSFCIDTSKMVEHKVVKPQKKPAPGVTNEHFGPSSDDEEEEEMEDEEDDVDVEGEEGEEKIEEVQTAPFHPATKKKSTSKSRNSHGSRGLCFVWEWIFVRSNTTSTFRTSISLTTKASW
jgi:hypothetical protein